MSQRSTTPDAVATTPPAPVTAPSSTSIPQCGPHDLECRIQRSLQSHPGLKFSRLTVHQCPQGVCLEGLLEENTEEVDLCELVNRITDINVINHVVSHKSKAK